MMAIRILGAALLLVLPTLAHSQESRPLTRAEQRLDLFGIEGTSARQDMPEILPSDDDGRKSPALAAVFSLVLPGMGELYAGGFSSGKYFLIADGALWLTYAGVEMYGNSLRDDSRSYAISAAGINPAGKDDQFYVDIGNFLTLEEYNEKQLRDREPDRLYDAAAGYAWEWTSDAARAAYRDQRISSEEAYNARKFVVAGLIINRVASAINAARSAISHNSSLEQALGRVEFSASVLGGLDAPHGVELSVRMGL